MRVQLSAFQVQSSQSLHVLNRVTWGARPRDLERIAVIGVNAFIDEQLQPESVADPFIDGYIAARRILAMNVRELDQGDYSTILNTMLGARLMRAVYSERQLYERMVEFWTDHFNIPIGDLLSYKIVDDREVIRRHAMGTFRDLLFASARSPAMLYYLNNDSSTSEHPNENYARELMELHTLGVDGGYTESDVIAVARAFTGWTVRNGEFHFDPYIHDQDEKYILGARFPAGRGIEDGLQVLDLLANHPSTARFVCFKLCRRFIGDNPPPSIVDSAANVFLQTRGSIRDVLRHILTSEEFMASQGQKFRRPFEYLVAILRVLDPGIQIQNPSELVWSLEALGQVPFFWHPPNGYPDVSDAWINTNGLLHRWNLAMNIALSGDGYLSSAALNVTAVLPPQPTAGALVDAASERILGMILPEPDRQTMVAYVASSADTPIDASRYYSRAPGLIGLLLASPYFQWS
jgi:uncharacterized protein (DUF1800 family)